MINSRITGMILVLVVGTYSLFIMTGYQNTIASNSPILSNMQRISVIKLTN